MLEILFIQSNRLTMLIISPRVGHFFQSSFLYPHGQHLDYSFNSDSFLPGNFVIFMLASDTARGRLLYQSVQKQKKSLQRLQDFVRRFAASVSTKLNSRQAYSRLHDRQISLSKFSELKPSLKTKIQFIRSSVTKEPFQQTLHFEPTNCSSHYE